MLKILGEQYYLDLNNLEKIINIETKTKKDESDEFHINVVKYETIKLMIEVIMDPQEPIDEVMGVKSNELGIPFKIAYNTLLNYKILNKY
jgi:hypothetical protein